MCSISESVIRRRYCRLRRRRYSNPPICVQDSSVEAELLTGCPSELSSPASFDALIEESESVDEGPAPETLDDNEPHHARRTLLATTRDSATLRDLGGSVAAAAAAAPRAETAPEEAALTTALETGEDRASGPNCGRWCSRPTCGWRGCRGRRCRWISCKVCPVGKTQTVQNPVVRMCVCACVNFCVCVFAPTQSQSGHNEEERGRRGGAK